VFFIAGIATVKPARLRESSNVFALPTYLFVISFAGMLAYGFVRLDCRMGDAPAARRRGCEMSQDLTDLLVLRAFASGCAALTGGGGGVGRRARVRPSGIAQRASGPGPGSGSS